MTIIRTFKGNGARILPLYTMSKEDRKFWQLLPKVREEWRKRKEAQ